MAIVAGGLSRDGLYRASSKAAHLRIGNSRAAAGLSLCCLDVEQRILRRMEVATSNACASFDEHMRLFAE